MKIPLIDLQAQFAGLREEALRRVGEVLESGAYVSGSESAQLESEIAALTGANNAVSLANGTDALILALHAGGIGPGDEVITTPYTFFATAEAIARVGATPVFADINPHTYNLDPQLAESCITPRTKAIIPVHLFGQPADMDAFMALGERYGLTIIEDACQALGATYKGRPVGSIGDFGCISFFPTKNLGGCGDGGMVLVKDKDHAALIRKLALHGSSARYYHDAVGYNSRLDEIQAALLRIKLRSLPHWNELRRQHAQTYRTLLQGAPLGLPYASPESTHVYHLFIVETAARAALTRHLEAAGIASGQYYPCPLHLQRAFHDLGYKPGDLPVAEAASVRTLALPLYAELTTAQLQFICRAIHQFGGDS